MLCRPQIVFAAERLEKVAITVSRPEVAGAKINLVTPPKIAYRGYWNNILQNAYRIRRGTHNTLWLPHTANVCSWLNSYTMGIRRFDRLVSYVLCAGKEDEADDK